MLAGLVQLNDLPVATTTQSVAVDGDFAVVGDYTAFAYEAFVLQRDDKGTADLLDDEWNQIAKLVPTQQFSNANEVAIDGTSIVVGGPNSPFVHVYEMPTGGWSGTMTETARFLGNGPIAISGDTVFASDQVFVRPATGWEDMQQPSAELVPPTGVSGSLRNFAAQGDTVVVNFHDIFAGSSSFYVYTKPAGGWNGDRSPSATLGTSFTPDIIDVSLRGAAVFDDVIAIGIETSNEAFERRYRVQIYERGATWSGTEGSDAVLRRSGNPVCDFESVDCYRFGDSILLDDERIIVGAPNGSDLAASPGRFYVFEKPNSGNWSSRNGSDQRIDGDFIDDGFGGYPDTGFGRQGATDGDTYLLMGFNGVPKVYRSAPVITSPNTAIISENSQTVHVLSATDAAFTFSVAGSGADNGLFEIANLNELRFITAPDFENPTAAGGGNIYVVSIQADDGNGSTADQTITVTVDPVNEYVPVLGAIGNRAIDQGMELTFSTTASDDDLPANGLAFSLDTGAPTGATIDSTTGVFNWTPTEGDGSGTFNVTVRVTDNGTPSLADFETITITVNEVNVALTITSPTTANVEENTTVVHTLTATDTDLPAQTITFSLTGSDADSGADNVLFEIDGGGQLQFITAPDFENPIDLGGTAGDNVYEVSVQADDGNGGTVAQTILVTVTQVADPDFDQNGIIDAGDLVIWQFGFGLLNAGLADGDADNDNDVDGADFLAWQRGFGTSALSATQADGDASQSFETPVAQAPPIDRRAELIDAAIAVGLIRNGQEAEVPSLDEEPDFAETYADLVFAAEATALVGPFVDAYERPAANSSNVAAAEDTWLADELLERVFG